MNFFRISCFSALFIICTTYVASEIHQKTICMIKDTYTPIEQTLISLHQDNLANLSRELRQRNPYPMRLKSHKIWHEQAEYNIPLLILSSIYLNNFCSEKKIGTILFSQRNCYHWRRIFQSLFPHYKSIDFMTSRIAYYQPTPEYVEYVRGLCQDPFVIADGYGTGASCLVFFKNHFSITPIHLAIIRKGNLCPGIGYGHLQNIEKLNYAPYGTLLKLTKQGPVRARVEYPVKHIIPASSCVDLAINLISSYPPQSFSLDAFNALFVAIKHHKAAMGSYHICRAGAHSGVKTSS